MKFRNILLISMLVMLVCCVTAVSATDINSTDDTVITDEIAVDDVSEIVEEAEIDDVSEDIVEENEEVIDECECNCEGANSVTINNTNYVNYFNADGWTTTNNNLTFVGNFTPKTFGNFKIGSSIIVNACGATFTNVGFDLKVSYVTLCGGTFIGDATTNLTSVISATADHATIKCVTMNLTAPENKTFYALTLSNAGNSKVTNNDIYYVDNYDNDKLYNYIVKVVDSPVVEMDKNNITAILPMKTIEWYDENLTGINRNFVAGVVISVSNNFTFTGNNLDITGNKRVSYGPTLDAVLISESSDVIVEGNTIIEKDINSTDGQYSYLYGVDAIQCGNLKINNNTIIMNADHSGGYVGGNGTGAAYCVQLTGPHTGVVVSNNRLTTQNNGPNAAIYSQNYFGETSIEVTNNTIAVTGKGTSATWDVVTGMELQDNSATVTGNTITVNNIGNYVSGYNVYGISYCQFTNTTHTYDIQNNTINVNNGRYTIYIMDGSYCNVTNNTLSSKYPRHNYSGNQTVVVNGHDNNIGPNN